MSRSFDNPIAKENAYRLICLLNADEGGQDAQSARGWIKYSSYYDARLTLTDGSYIYRDFASGELHHANVTLDDIMADFGFWK